MQFRIEPNLIVQVSFEVGPVSATESRTIRWVLQDERQAMSMSTGMVRAYRRARIHIHLEREVLRFHDVQNIGEAEGLYGLVVGM